MTQYDFTKSPLDVARLTKEVQASAIAVALDHMSALGSDLSIFFRADLSEAEQAILSALVTAHTGTPLPENVIATVTMTAFASKTLGDKKLYKRVVGKQFTLVQGDNDLFYTGTFPWVKLMALEVIGAELGDYCSLYVLDTTTGTFTGVPNYVLNQFGYSANIAKDYYVQRSEFDADVYAGLQIKIVYHSVSAKNLGINYVMNEIK